MSESSQGSCAACKSHHRQAGSDSATYDPIGWCSSMAGANLAGILKAFGDNAEIKSCELHFKDHRKKKIKNMIVKAMTSSNRLLLCTTVGGTRLPNLIWTY